MATSFVLNGNSVTLDADPAMPLLWAIREFAGLTGTKFGCGMALCGACTVHLDGDPIGTRSVNDPSANNVAQVIIQGGQRHTGTDSNNMPEFGNTYSDAEIAHIANYVTARFGAKGSDLTAEKVAKLRRED